MFEAKLTEGHILKKIVEAIKDIVTDVNIDVSPSGKLRNFPLVYFHSVRYKNNLISLEKPRKMLTINLGLSLQAMDTSHVALVSLNLSMEGFESYRCD